MQVGVWKRGELSVGGILPHKLQQLSVLPVPHINQPAGRRPEMAKNQPVVKFKLGYVTATVWQNDKFYSTVLSKSYKDASDEWQETDQLGTGDLLNAVRVLQRAEDFISTQV
jgi:hypothetical protein